jgi:hypothetical protein
MVWWPFAPSPKGRTDWKSLTCTAARLLSTRRLRGENCLLVSAQRRCAFVVMCHSLLIANLGYSTNRMRHYIRCFVKLPRKSLSLPRAQKLLRFLFACQVFVFCREIFVMFLLAAVPR